MTDSPVEVRAKTAVVVPCYRTGRTVAAVVAGIPHWVDHIIVVDDACPERSGDVAEATGAPRLIVLRHEVNQGVGGAVVTGYRKALELGCDIVVKMDGDGQMDPADAARLIEPLLADRADYAKGNRFHDFRALRAMPPARLFGNSVMSFFIKFASGYWNLMDPANGYTAIHRRALAQLNLDRLDRRYFFESDMLINLNIVGAVAVDVAIPARYGDESSSLSIPRAAAAFPLKIARGLLRRLFFRYFLYDFNMASVYILVGTPLVAFGLGLGLFEWYLSLTTGQPRALGTVMLVVLPIILGFQMLLQAVSIDINAVPRRPGAAP
jgi:glycosyltransferase involved in cell wall biosynthesis